MPKTVKHKAGPARRVLVLWATSESSNLGVQALAEGAKIIVTNVAPTVSVDFLTYGDGNDWSTVTNKKMFRELILPSRRFRDWISQFDAVLDTRAGDCFSDIYGLKNLLSMTLFAFLARRSGARLALMPQTIGPFDSWWAKRVYSVSIKWYRLAFARDSRSHDVLAQSGKVNAVLTTDMVFALPQDSERSARRPVSRIAFSISGLLWDSNPHADFVAYRKLIVGTLRSLVAEGHEVVLMSHVIDSPSLDNDERVISAFVEAEPEFGFLERFTPTDVQGVRRFIATCDLVVSSRLHACLNALSQGVPAVGVSYSPKFAPLLGDVGWPYFLVLTQGEVDSARLLELITIATSDRERAAEVVRRAHKLQALIPGALSASFEWS